MENRITGRVWKYGDDVNTDVIFPGKYTYSVTDRKEMAQHALEDLDPSFVKNVQPGDIIVAGKNWGCGSSREQAVIALKEVGVGAIVARSFARIFYRNAINVGLALIEADVACQKGDTVEVDLAEGLVRVQGRVYRGTRLPDFLRAILDDGGLVAHRRKEKGLA